MADESSSTRFIPLSDNLVDKIHTPSPRSDAPLYDYPLSIAGKSTACKLQDLRATLSSKVRRGQEWVYIIPALASIAWLLNYRCDGDVSGCPIAYAYAAITRDECVLFVSEEKVNDEHLRQRWEDDGVRIRPYGVDEIERFVNGVVSSTSSSASMKDGRPNVKLWAPKECSWAIQRACQSSKFDLLDLSTASSSIEISIIQCPIEEAKAIKNDDEIQGMRNAYLRDGRATVSFQHLSVSSEKLMKQVRFLSFLNEKLLKEKRPVGEWAAGQILTRYRRQEDNFKSVIPGNNPR